MRLWRVESACRLKATRKESILDRREFLTSLGAAAVPMAAETPARRGVERLTSFDYRGVRLLPSLLRRQVEQTASTYAALADDSILHGFRAAAGLAAPGTAMQGWASRTSSATFGQWVSGLARLGCALQDAALVEKAARLASGWGATLRPDGNARMNLYDWEKLICGLVDVAVYGGFQDAWGLLERTTRYGSAHFDRARTPATPADRDGRRPRGTHEWYTLPENLLRAWLHTGNGLYREFADEWRYESYWRQFAEETAPRGAALLHSYSHLNTFNSAAMVYAATGDAVYLKILENAYEYMTRTQCYASGGYGPGEWSVPPDGALGRALEIRTDHAEVPCGCWGAFKLAKSLLCFTGRAQYGDWIETLVYNGLAASLPTQTDGRTYYYADYRLGSATKLYHWDKWPCCSGTYIQAVADYHDLIYFRSAEGLHVNLFVPSEASWTHAGQRVTVRQSTGYPESGEILLKVEVERPLRMKVGLRVPAWAGEVAVRVNGVVAGGGKPGEWAAVEREWQNGDRLEMSLPLGLRLLAVDGFHARRCAVMHGPVMLAQPAQFTMPFSLRGDASLDAALIRDSGLHFHAKDPGPYEQKTGPFVPYWEIGERNPYRTYFDLDAPRFL